MNPELQDYILRYCTQFMALTELQVLKRLTLTVNGEESYRRAADTNPAFERAWGFKNEETNRMLAGGDADSIRRQIAQRLWTEADRSVFNFCPECEALARTPTARQCRHCGHDWH